MREREGEGERDREGEREIEKAAFLTSYRQPKHSAACGGHMAMGVQGLQCNL